MKAGAEENSYLHHHMHWSPSGHNTAPLTRLCVSLLPQSSNPNVLLQWPHALHILGLIYNQQL